MENKKFAERAIEWPFQRDDGITSAHAPDIMMFRIDVTIASVWFNAHSHDPGLELSLCMLIQTSQKPEGIISRAKQTSTHPIYSDFCPISISVIR